MPAFLTRLDTVGLLLWVAAFFVTMTLAGLAQGFLIERLLTKRRMFDVPLAKGQYRFELIGNLVFVAVAIAAVTGVLSLGWVRFADGWLRGIGTFVALMFGFQFFYYFLHRAMHHRLLLRFHRWHHRSQVTTPLSGQSVSFVEACGWMLGYVGLPLVFSLVVPISFEGWAAYVGFNVFGNIVGHSNVEPNGPQFGNREIIWAVSPFIFHGLHHARWTGHYSFQAGAMDRLFKTEWDDWPQLFKRIIDGRPLTSLKDRGDVEPQQAVEKGT